VRGLSKGKGEEKERSNKFQSSVEKAVRKKFDHVKRRGQNLMCGSTTTGGLKRGKS